MTPLGAKQMTALGLLIAGLLSIALYGGYRLWETNEWNRILEVKTKILEQDLAASEDYVTNLKTDLAHAEEDKKNLTDALTGEQTKNQAFEAQIRDISGAVGTLQKLSKIDPELLRKYSKVYFLSDNYAPAQLSPIKADYLYDKAKPQLIHSHTQRFLESMIASAASDGVTLQVVSAFRSFAEQTSIKYGYKITYGAGSANQFSADQGYSEHQLGTTCDLTSPEIGGISLAFEKTKAYEWLTNNAYKFGFILSYPKNNTYYQFEPWHWRFVGIPLASSLHTQGKYFYELTQREINEYLVSIFD